MLRSSLAVATILFAGVPVEAASYSAQLAAPVSQRVIAPDIVWMCGADACQGSTAESRPIVLCESLAKRAGRVNGFLVDGRAFTASELDRCNAAAKRESPRTLAAQ
jgi:hypothetical protein